MISFDKWTPLPKDLRSQALTMIDAANAVIAAANAYQVAYELGAENAPQLKQTLYDAILIAERQEFFQ